MRLAVSAGFLTTLLAAGACGGDTIVEPPPPTLIGSARVSWAMVSTAGAPLTCSDIRIDNAAISVGGETKVVNCGDAMSVAFDGLLASRYPVIIELRTLGTGVAYETRGNVVVEGGKEATLELTFTIDLNNALNGAALISWRIDDTPAAQGCAGVDGQTVRITDLDGSIAEVDVSAPCTDGQVMISMMRPGAYGLRLELIDSTGSRVTVSSIETLNVKAGETTTPLQVELITMPLTRAKLYASWTVNGTAAVAGCAAVNADAVVVKAFPEDETVPSVTATSACDRGFILADRVPPGGRPHRVVFQLYTGFSTVPPIPAVLTSTIVYGIIFRAGETSSVSADLRSM